MTACILIIEDDQGFTNVLQISLRRQGYHVLAAPDGAAGLHMVREQRPDLVLLDVSLPGMDGMQVCQSIRRISNVPILMMTAHAVNEYEIVQGLELGADEYVLKPLRQPELQARVKALLRRARVQHDTTAPIGYRDDYLHVDLATRQVRVKDAEVRLTPTEYKLLAAFIRRPGEVLTFAQLLVEVWGEAYQTEHHYPRIYVSHLRRKIEPDPQQPRYIVNEYGIGYRFVSAVP